MIKNTIIIILLLLLLITFYAYMCLSSNMIDFQKERMEHIVKKEKELKYKEQKLISTQECNDNLNKYKLLIGKITSDLTKTTNEMNLLSKYANQTNNSINNDIGKLIQPIQSIQPTQQTQNHTAIVASAGQEIPVEKTEKELFENWNGYDYYDNEYILFRLFQKRLFHKKPTKN